MSRADDPDGHWAGEEPATGAHKHASPRPRAALRFLEPRLPWRPDFVSWLLWCIALAMSLFGSITACFQR